MGGRSSTIGTMSVRMRRWLYRIRGRTSLLHYYATIHAKTCEQCLNHHGRIYEEPEPGATPPLHAGCRCELLEFPVKELETYRERGARMKETARQELERRQLFREARDAWALRDEDGRSKALALFERAASIDVYLQEIEAFCQECEKALRASPESTRELRNLFLNAYRHKHDRERYVHMPERMRAERREHGLVTIRRLFQQYGPHSEGWDA